MERQTRSGQALGRKGFTLVELMSAIAVTGVTLLAGVPALYGLLEQQRIYSHTSRLLGHLQLARSESVKTRHRIGLCPSHDGQSCVDSFDWSQGWIMFADHNRDRLRDPDEPLVRVSQARGAIRILTTTGRRQIIYEPDGTVLGGSNATFRLCGTGDPSRNRAVIISMTGRARSSNKDRSNRPVDCG